VILPAATYDRLKAECDRTGNTMTVVVIRQLNALPAPRRPVSQSLSQTQPQRKP
jgi:hypothetical protein